jgi:ABC-2 type transport system permease protein
MKDEAGAMGNASVRTEALTDSSFILHPSSLPSIRRAFRTARRRSVSNIIHRTLGANRFRLAVVLGVSAVFWLLVFVFFWEGFTFLNRTQLFNQAIAEVLFRMFFGSLLVMLVFSTGILMHGGLFNSREAAFLLATPAPEDHVFAFKFQEAMFFSSWGFLLIGSPMTLAYGITSGAPFHFHVFAVFFFLAFAVLPGSLGALACLLIARFLPRKRKHVFAAIGALLLAGVAWMAWSLWLRFKIDAAGRAWLTSLVEQMTGFDLVLLPSQWITKGLLAASYHDPQGPADALFQLALLAANAGLCYLVTAWLFRKLYRTAYDRVHTEGERRTPARSRQGLTRWLLSPLELLPRRTRTLVRKDVLTFVRDPVQWSQVLIFMGLLVFYLLTLGRMNYYTNSPYWRNLIGFFNISVTGLILSTFTSRFIFPLVSLECQKFWVLAPSPISRREILWGKFAFSAGGALVVTLTITLVGALMLKLDALLLALQFLTVIVLCFGLSGIAVGLGARFPEVKETDPSRIAAGVGGTLNLVASLAFLALTVGLMALPCHFYSIAQTIHVGADAGATTVVDSSTAFAISEGTFRAWLAGSALVSVALGAAAVWLPIRMGVRAFERLEF